MAIHIGKSGTTVVEFAQPQELVVSAADDSIAIANQAATNFLTVNADGSINVRSTNVNAIEGLTGDVTATGPGTVAATVALVGGASAANVAAATTLANAATDANTASTIVKRNGSGNFTAGTITATLSGAATSATTATKPASGSARGAVTLDASANFQSVAPGTSGKVLRSDGTDWASASIATTDLPTTIQTSTIGITIDGAGQTLTTGVKGYVTVPFNCTVTGWDVLADASGAVVVDVLKSSYANFPPVDSIAGTELPTITASAQKAQDYTLTTWSSSGSITAGDVVAFKVNSCTAITRATVVLKVTKG